MPSTTDPELGATPLKRHVRDPGAIVDLAESIAQGKLDPRALIEDLLARCAAVEGDVHAWCGLDREVALREAEARAREIREGGPHGPLHGIPFGVKDVIDVAGWPTRAGSRIRAAVAPATLDAEIVAAARAAGAIVLGKCHTTEFAYFDGPPPTRNPWNCDHTPGGSSAGPAAAVAAGMAVFSLGTQTAGSVVRPAAFCGIAAFKPTTQSIGTSGIVPLAPAFDTPGYFAMRVADVALVTSVLLPAAPRPPRRDSANGLRIGIVEDELLAASSAAAGASIDEVELRLRMAGHVVSRIPSPVALRGILVLHATILEYELARVHGYLRDAPADEVGTRLREAVIRGGQISEDEYRAARHRLAEAREHFWAFPAGLDAWVAPAAPGEAPPGMQTGDPRFIIPFTALGGPIMTVPVAVTGGGLPLGVMILGRPGDDVALVDAAATMAASIELPR